MSKVLFNNDNFIVYVPDDFEFEASYFENALNEQRNKMLSFFKLRDMQKIEITLFNNKDEYQQFRKARGEEVPKYARGSFTLREILQSIDNRNKLSLADSLKHELTHIIYNNFYKGRYDRITWLDEGIAQFYSDEKNLFDITIEQFDYKRFRRWYLINISNIIHQVPNIKTLYKHGEQFCNEVYSGYDLSYIAYYYLNTLYNEDELLEVLSSEEKIKEIEEYILFDSINYFNKYFGVENVKDNINDITNLDELMDYMDKYIYYGWIDVNGYNHVNNLTDLKTLYRINSLDQVINSHLGTCIEQAMLEKNVMERLGYETRIFGFFRENNQMFHAIVYGFKDGVWYRFEHANLMRQGISTYESLDDAVEDSKTKYNVDDLVEIDDITVGLSYPEFIKKIFDKEVVMKKDTL